MFKKLFFLMATLALVLGTLNSASANEAGRRRKMPYVRARQQNKPYTYRPVTRYHYRGSGNAHRGIFRYFH